MGQELANKSQYDRYVEAALRSGSVKKAVAIVLFAYPHKNRMMGKEVAEILVEKAKKIGIPQDPKLPRQVRTFLGYLLNLGMSIKKLELKQYPAPVYEANRDMPLTDVLEYIDNKKASPIPKPRNIKDPEIVRLKGLEIVVHGDVHLHIQGVD